MNIKDIIKYELIGCSVEITDSENKSLIGIKGKIIDETKNMLTLDNQKKIIKDQSILKIEINKKTYQINGKLLVGRSEDRLKKRIKWKSEST